MDAIIKLRKKISNESLQERQMQRQTHRYYTIPHQMKSLPIANTGEYVRSQFYQKPPEVLAEEKGIPLPELLKQMEPQPTGEGSGA
jgi:NAD(P)H-quinone oxidoreductase subunit K